MPFFHFDQNNSGGGYDADENVAQLVVIEAPNANAANIIAQEIGIYFDGIDNGMDCECCGNRWSRAYDGEGESAPNEGRIAMHSSWKSQGNPYAFVHFADGRKLSYS
jgi:hypothetical protein